MIDWDAWHTLLATARAGTLVGASGTLGLDATTTGRRIKRLEQRLGQRLFERIGGRLEPTPACASLLPYLAAAERALEDAFAVSTAREEAARIRVVRITSVSFLCDHVLAPALPRLLAGRRLRVELIADGRNLSLARGEADVALRLGAPSGTGHPARLVGMLRYAAYATASADPASLPWAGLDTTLAHLPEFRWTERMAGPDGVAFRVNRIESSRSLVTAGLARALLPCCQADRDPGLVRLTDRGVVERPLWLIIAAEEAEGPHIRAVAEWIETTCRMLE